MKSHVSVFLIQGFLWKNRLTIRNSAKFETTLKSRTNSYKTGTSFLKHTKQLYHGHATTEHVTTSVKRICLAALIIHSYFTT